MADIGIIKFRLGEMNFCMYSDRIVEIVRFTGVRQIPRPLPYVVGIIQLRKRVVAVVDLRKRLGLPPITLSKDTALIVVNLSVGMFGLLVDAIADFKRIAEALILPPISLAGFPEHLLHGVLTEKDDILLLPHFDKIFASYINIAVVPISASEKIAFQYRFTPGALSRTLENILLHQPCLDPEIARELPHALFLPSCRVHKMTSYYPDFQPRQALVKKPEPRRGTSQKLRSGDEQYASLSQRLQQRLRGETSIKGEGEADLLDGLLADPQASISKRLEDILHKGAGPAATGRKLAQALQLAPTALTKYLTYYASPLLGGAGVGLPLSIINCQSIPLLGGVGVGLPRSREAGGELSIVNYQLSIVNCQLIPLLGGVGVRLPLESRLQQLFTAKTPLFQTLQALSAERYVLTRPQLARICAYYQVAPAKLAQLASFFPECAVALEPPPVEPHRAEGETPAAQPVLPAPETAAALFVRLKPASTSVSEWLRALAEIKQLAEDRSVRLVAARLRVSTCRLSKLRSYYRWRHE